VPRLEHLLAQELLENVLSKPVDDGAWLASLDGDDFVTVEGVVAGFEFFAHLVTVFAACSLRRLQTGGFDAG